MTVYGSYYNRELLHSVSEGDQVAFRQLYDHYKKGLYDFALGITRSVPVAEDILQESFVRIWKNRNELPMVDNPDAWIFTIVRNLCYTALRKAALELKSRAIYNRAENNPESIEDRITDKQHQALLQEAIRQLPEQQKKIYLMSRESGMNYEEIAEALGISRNTVKEHLRRALAAIRTYLETRLAISFILLLTSSGFSDHLPR